MGLFSKYKHIQGLARYGFTPHLLKKLSKHGKHGGGDEFKKLPTMSHGQKDYLKQILGQLGGQGIDLNESPLFKSGESYLQNLMSESPEAYENFKAPMMREFNEEIIPNISERA